MLKPQIHYEAPEDGDGGVSDPEVQEPIAEQGTGDQAGAEEQAAWSLSQDDWNATVSYLQQTAPIIEQVAQLMQAQQAQQYQQFDQQQPPGEQPLPEFDPWDPQTIQDYINASIERGVQQQVG